MFQHITECFRWNICSYMWFGSLGVLSLTVIILSACLHRFRQRVKRLKRIKAQQLEQEPQYASLQKLPVSSSKLMDREGGESTEDPGTDYACIAKRRPT